MKTSKISKILGVGLALAMLTSLLAVGSPASAGTLAYTTEGLPSVVTSSFQDYAVSADGNTIYAVTGSGSLSKSTNGGASFTATSITGASTLNLVAVAPDDANVVVVANNVTGAHSILITTNGGSTGGVDSWTSESTVATAVATIKDLAISPAVSGVRQVTISGANATGGAAISTLNLGGTVANWTNIANGSGVISGATSPVYAIKYSPNYISDRLLTAVAQDSVSGNVTLNLFKFTTATAGLWNTAASFTEHTGTGTSNGLIVGSASTNPVAAPLMTADISLAPAFTGADSASRTAFVALDNGATGGVYQLKDAVSKLISDAVRMRSVAFNGTNLVAGRADSNVTYRSADSTASSPTLTSTTQFQRPAGAIGTALASNTTVAWAGSNVVASTGGPGSAFSRSTDNGANYQDISSYLTPIGTIIDIAVVSNGSKWYAVTTNATSTEVDVWAKTGTTWERLIAIMAPTSTTFSLRLAPENSQVVYVVQRGSTNIYFTDDGGVNNWVARTSNESIVDLAVESASVLYYANGANVRKSTNGGFLWNDPAVASLLSTSGSPKSLKSLGKDLLIETATSASTGTGTVSYSTNGGTTWTRPTGITGSGDLQATAATLATGDFIYVAYGATGGGLARYKIGSVAPDNVWKAISVAAGPGEIFTGIALKSGILYAHSLTTVAAGGTYNGSQLWRSLNPAEAGETTVTFSQLQAGLPLPATWAPDFTNTGRISNIQVSTNATNTIWGIDTDVAVAEENGDSTTAINDEVYTLNDTLSAAVTTTAPAADAVIAMNPVSGGSYATSLSFNRPSLATAYQIDLAFDSAFKQPALTSIMLGGVGATVPLADPAITPVSAVLAAGALNPGTTYYWRVRATAPLYSPYSATGTFSTSSLDAPFTLSRPAVGATDIGTMPVLSWSAYKGALWYEVTLSEYPDFSIPEWSHNVGSATNPAITALAYAVTKDETLKYGTTYFWRVRGVTATPFVKGTTIITPAGPWQIGAFTTMTEPVAPKAEQVIITQQAPAPPPQIVEVTKEVLVQQPIPNWMLMTIIVIGAVLVIALIVLIVRTRRVA